MPLHAVACYSLISSINIIHSRQTSPQNKQTLKTTTTCCESSKSLTVLFVLSYRHRRFSFSSSSPSLVVASSFSCSPVLVRCGQVLLHPRAVHPIKDGPHYLDERKHPSTTARTTRRQDCTYPSALTFVGHTCITSNIYTPTLPNSNNDGLRRS
ncbi:hypothetical protein F5Y01DRAFT_89668 [Xylaria sp. FL0043]|nr:hypothetical protein F5Y01DRAFT_89668 [Xylaria sp. FL0043]